MLFSTDELRALAAGAMPLVERLSSTVPVEGEGSAVIEARLRAWKAAVADGDEATFAVRLAALGLTDQTCRAFLGHVRLNDDQELPSWVTTFTDILAFKAAGSAVPDRCLIPDEPLPFEEVLLPFLRYARSRVDGQLSGLMTDQARTALERQFLREITKLASVALGKRFHQFRSVSDPLSILGIKGEAGPNPRSRYCQFVTWLQGRGFREFFLEYPVLARLLVTRTQQWIEWLNEFAARLRTDHPLLIRAFCDGKHPGLITELRAGLSDPHNGGRGVLVLRFQSGRQAVYKPKSVGLDAAFADLLDWLKEHHAPCHFRAVKLVDRKTHGWVEYVPYRPCTNQEEARQFYRNAGELLCLVYAFQGTDCHCENLIAEGCNPVLIDLETLLVPRVRTWVEREKRESGGTADYLAGEALGDSVLQTGFLPTWEWGHDGKSFDISGLGSMEDQGTGFRIVDWENVNTDRMELALREETTGNQENCPVLDGRKLCPYEYQEALVEGFATTYQYLVSQRAALLAADGPIHQFLNRSGRFIIRPTGIYDLIHARLRHPEFLQSGVDRSIEIEKLAFFFARSGPSDRPSDCWPLYERERESMEKLDIPYFACRCDNRDFDLGGGMVLADFFSEPSLNRAAEHIREMSEEDLAVQSGYIRAALFARFGAQRHGVQPVPSKTDRSQAGGEVAAEVKLEEAAFAIAEQIRLSAVKGIKGTVGWISLVESDDISETLRLMPVGPSLFNGRCGIALFLAALERITGCTEFRDLLLATLQPVRAPLRTASTRTAFAKKYVLGAGTGLGGMIYALCRAGQLIDDGGLIEDALLLAGEVTPGRIAQADEVDLLHGVSGALLGLLSLKGLMNGRLSEILGLCGRRLLELREATPQGVRSWRNRKSPRFLTGLSHGTAGVVFALARLYEVTKEAAYRDAAHEAIAYEASVFDPGVNNWPDFRPEDRKDGGNPQFAFAWCNGGPGIGLARLAGTASLSSPQVERDIEVAIAATRTYPLGGPDHVCCGTFGRIELLLSAGRCFGRAELVDEARQAANWSVTRQRRAGGYLLNDASTGMVPNPTFFRGTAGIGYQLLRLAVPDRLPCVLTWE